MWKSPPNIWVNRDDVLTEELFTKLVEEYYHILFNFGCTFCENEALLKDTIQDLFLSIWENRDRFEIKHPRSYLLKSLRNNLYRNLKGQKTISPDDADLHDLLEHESSIEDTIITDEALFQSTCELEAAIAKLSSKQKEVVFLKYYQGLSNDEIAQILSINKQSVANSIHRIITTLRKNLPTNYAALSAFILLLGKY